MCLVDGAQRKKFNSDWIEMQLAHTDEDEVRVTYNSAQWLSGRRTMLKWWSDYLDQQRDCGDLVG